MKRIGTQRRLSDEKRNDLLLALNWWRERSRNFYHDRTTAEEAFYCVWDGQHADGTVHDTRKELAWPFDGASDQRVRWGEKVVLDKIALVMIALSSCEVEFACGAGPDAERRANALKRLLGWELGRLGAKGYAEFLALLRYMLVDSPAVAAMDVSWRRRASLAVRELNAEELAGKFAAFSSEKGIVNSEEVENYSLSTDTYSLAEAEGRFWMGLRGEDEAAQAQLDAFLVAQGVRDQDASAVREALAEDGECECLCRGQADEGVELKALRYGDDFCIPREASDFDYAAPLCRGEWGTEEQLRERIDEDGWDPEWVEEELRHKGTSFYDEASRPNEDVKDLCNIVWCYEAITTDAGETVRWVTVLGHADGSAFGQRAIRSRRGTWGVAFFRREVTGRNLLASRGLAALCAPDQGVAKEVRDMAANNAIVGSLPPVKAKGSRTRNAAIEPFAVINMGVNDDLLFMQPPAYPAAAKETEERLKAELLAYVGVSDGKTDVTERRQEEVNWFLKQFQDLFVLMVESAQDHASDEALAGVTGEGDVAGLRREDITGAFGITLKLDPRNLDNKALLDKVQAFAGVLQSIDRERAVDTLPVLRHVMRQLWPEVSGEAMRSPDQLTANDIEDEKRNFALIKAGVMPQMDTQGRWNYQARLGFYQQLQQENPEAVAEMSPMAQENLQRWMQALEQQQTQFGENAEIGRTGVEGVEG